MVDSERFCVVEKINWDRNNIALHKQRRTWIPGFKMLYTVYMCLNAEQTKKNKKKSHTECHIETRSLISLFSVFLFLFFPEADWEPFIVIIDARNGNSMDRVFYVYFILCVYDMVFIFKNKSYVINHTIFFSLEDIGKVNPSTLNSTYIYSARAHTRNDFTVLYYSLSAHGTCIFCRYYRCWLLIFIVCGDAAATAAFSFSVW